MSCSVSLALSCSVSLAWSMLYLNIAVVSMDLHTQSIGNITPDGRYSYTNDLLSLRAAVPSLVQLPAECSRIVSPLQAEVWEKHLQDHPDRDFVGYLLEGIRNGFRIGCHNSMGLRSSASNMLGAERHPKVVQEYLKNELQAGHIVPVPPRWCTNVHLSRFGVILNKRQPGKWRLTCLLQTGQASMTSLTQVSAH